LRAGTLLLLLGVVAFLGCNVWIVFSTRQRVMEELADVPFHQTALVLGTSATLGDGRPNLHFTRRMKTAAELYHAGKVRRLLVSGDNHRRGYDEPTDMRDALMKLGVPEDKIERDYAGFRTLDSVARAGKVFGEKQLIVVTERFHAYRALFLCDQYGLDAVAYPAPSVAVRCSPRSRLREYAARVKAVLDVYLLGTQPRFWGEPKGRTASFEGRARLSFRLPAVDSGREPRSRREPYTTGILALQLWANSTLAVRTNQHEPEHFA
jgi:SanA protein